MLPDLDFRKSILRRTKLSFRSDQDISSIIECGCREPAMGARLHARDWSGRNRKCSEIGLSQRRHRVRRNARL